jgi:hypothetical protein
VGDETAQSDRPTPVAARTATLPSAIREKRAVSAVRTRVRSPSERPRVAWGVTRTSWTRPPIQTAAAAVWSASTATAGSPRPGSPAWPEKPGTMTAHVPSPAAGTARTSAATRLRRAMAKAAAVTTQNAAPRSIPRPNSRPNRVASSADAIGPWWLNACQNDTPATSAPWRVSATHPPASMSTAAPRSSALARALSRSSAIARGRPDTVASTGRNTATRKTAPPTSSMSPRKYANRALTKGQSTVDVWLAAACGGGRLRPTPIATTPEVMWPSSVATTRQRTV